MFLRKLMKTALAIRIFIVMEILINIILSDQAIDELYLWLGDLNYDNMIDIIDAVQLIDLILD